MPRQRQKLLGHFPFKLDIDEGKYIHIRRNPFLSKDQDKVNVYHGNLKYRMIQKVKIAILDAIF